jgi:hypothetical protein
MRSFVRVCICVWAFAYVFFPQKMYKTIEFTIECGCYVLNCGADVENFATFPQFKVDFESYICDLPCDYSH